MVRPGELNLMTAGRGISHSEVSPASTTTLHGAQLWLALPEAGRHVDPTFDHYAPEPIGGDGWTARVFLGSLLGASSPVATHSPLVGAEILLEPLTHLSLDVDPAYEHGVLIDSGVATVARHEVKQNELGYVPPGQPTLSITSHDHPVRLLLLGGEPFGEPIVMWWNFVGRSHEEIVAFRAEWQAQITADDTVVGDSQDVADGRFGVVVGDHLPPIPAPPMPNARLKQRR
jgi:redox-sensitive bicupin YhaK (pirin superfamily)